MKYIIYSISILIILSCKQQEEYFEETTESVAQTEGPALIQNTEYIETTLDNTNLETYIVGEWRATNVTAKQDLDNEEMMMLDAFKGVFGKIIYKFYNDGTYIIKDPYDENHDEFGNYKIFGDGEYLNLTKEGEHEADKFYYINNKLFFKLSHEYLDLEVEFSKI